MKVGGGGGGIFRGGEEGSCSFYMKNQLKSDIYHEKNFYKVRILTKHFVTFKR